MARRIDTSAYSTFGQITERLDEIVVQVRRKDLPLESSLDLFDEAIALGSKAVDFVDTAPVEAHEAMAAEESAAQNAPAEDADVAKAEAR